MYVDDNIITRDDTNGIDNLKGYLQKHFQPKIFGFLKYFLGIEGVRSKKGILLSRRKYILDLPSEAGMLGYRSIDSLMDVNTKLLLDKRELLENVGRYMKLVGRLNYLTATRPDITFAVSVVSPFFVTTEDYHLGAVIRILSCLRKAPGGEFFIQIMDTQE